MKRIPSKHAVAYIASLKRKGVDAPSWEEVAGAYDDGIMHVLWAERRSRHSLTYYMRALRVVNAMRKGQQ